MRAAQLDPNKAMRDQQALLQQFYCAELEGFSYVPETILGECRGHDVHIGIQFSNSFDSAVLLLDEEGTVETLSGTPDGIFDISKFRNHYMATSLPMTAP
mmetsp:Transcript_98984/g.159608  ORF Transcript_98984/g.159608 Transcript_98984/m.159608 type:complete len:100 (+) Transcript_98984:381-680(+)